MPDREFVFGYGSLVALGQLAPTRAFSAEGFVTDLSDFRRCWGVAMNNRVSIPGYKYYLDDQGHRPHVHVAFLDVRPAPGESVNGVCLPVTRDHLAALDDRERNYVRRDVTAMCDVPADTARVWVYLGSSAGRRRLTTARAARRAVVDRAYLEGVAAAFTTLGPAEYELCAPSLDPGDLPVRPLDRHDLPFTTITT
jgi:cation transport regulator ChaC